MATEAIKSTAVTNMDTLPATRPTSGKGGFGYVKSVDAAASFADAVTSGSTYRLARLPWTAKVKHIRLALNAAVTTFTCDLGVYYSSSAYDTTPSANQSAVVDADFFGSAIALAAIVSMTDYVNESATYTAAKRQQELWEAVGLSSRPAGYADIVLTNTATNSTAGVVFAEVEFVD
jgi:hypothetical protein